MVETHEQAVTKGKKNRASGSTFEKRVRLDLESKGWIVDRWTNNVSDVYEQDIGEYVRDLIPAKAKWNNFTKTMMMGKGGFPDFVGFKLYPPKIEIENNFIKMNDAELGYFMDGIGKSKHIYLKTESNKYYEIIGVECKSNGTLTKLEKQKCQWYLNNNIFSRIDIAEKTKIKNRVVIVYHNFVERYGKSL